MPAIAFIDSEINPETEKILDLGAILDNEAKFHENSLPNFLKFIEKADFICGHNIFNHDLKYIEIKDKIFIDTLFWSPLLFPEEFHHNLSKDEKLLEGELNNPLNDAIKTKNLFNKELATFWNLDKKLIAIYYFLLRDKPEFNGLFKYLQKEKFLEDGESFLIRKIPDLEICKNAPLQELIKENPIELAYSLALINANELYSIIPPWILKNFPKTQMVMKKLRNSPCEKICNYCSQKLDVKKGLKHFFGFENFRKYADEPLQEKAADLAIKGKSILVLFPTGGGKSIAFQVPALMSGENEKGLTVVISPLQSLMKDQVDNLEKDGKTSAVTINGLLNPIERADAIKRVSDGSIHLLYISPESLRSNTIERLLLQRNVVRFVIDEAHCFSAWGQDFRPDYLYIASFIKRMQEKKNCENIPISCFTATAKREVIDDIRTYFNEKLGLNLELIEAKSSRENLTYTIIEKEAKDKYAELLNIISGKDCPTIVYVSRTKLAKSLAERLCNNGYNAKSFYAKLEPEVKIQNQNEFMQGAVQIMVATSAFGMGVDKKDVGLVVHYDISDSLENYLQEAGRAGRDENIKADCYVLFDENDLDELFLRLNRTKLSKKEINQIWTAIKTLSRNKKDPQKTVLKIYKSALEIAREAGWDESQYDIDTKVKAAINALEQSKYIERGNNLPQIFANSIMLKTMNEISQKIDSSTKFIDDKQKMAAKEIMSALVSSKSRQKANEYAEERVDYIADRLGLEMKYAIRVINILRDEKILADEKDITAFINSKDAKKKLKEFTDIENVIINKINEEDKIIHIKELNEELNSSPTRIKTIFNYLDIFGSIKREIFGNAIRVCALKDERELKKELENRLSLSNFIIEFLNERKENNFVDFSIIELKTSFNAENFLFKAEINDIENALFYLSKIEALNIEKGFFVIYNKLTIEKKSDRRDYINEEYKKLKQFYENKTTQIHIVGEFAKKMSNGKKEEALTFVKDYFNLGEKPFLDKYFDKNAQEKLKRNISPKKYEKLLEDLSSSQREIIYNKDDDYIVVAAGPGSGKTKTLVHKLASLVIMEDVKPEQLLMLTFSRAAATEFKERLINLIGVTAYFVEIKTFHSYCFDLLGKVGSLENSENVVSMAIEKIKDGETEQNRITKTCLVIDEAQDMSEAEFELVKILKEANDGMRIIAVGDDDQNIYEWRGSNSKYFESLSKEENSIRYALLDNYRSKANIVDFANNFAKSIKERMKINPIQAKEKENGEIIRYNSKDTIGSLISDVLKTPLVGTTCVLTFNNEDVLRIAGMLSEKGKHIKIIQDENEFSLWDIWEVRYFCKNLGDNPVVLDEIWEKAKRELNVKFKNTNGLEITENIITAFERTTQMKYRADFEIFIRESKLEDFLGKNENDTIFVSTMHKAKGKEFDNVFIMLNERFYTDSDERKRLLYVAMTRAKNLLHIHCKDSLHLPNVKTIQDDSEYPPVNRITMYLLSRWDGNINLGYSKSESKQSKIEKLDGNEDIRGKYLFDFSKGFKEKEIVELKNKGYEIKEIKAHFIVYWKGEDMDEEIKIILPRVVFEKVHI